MRLSFTNKVKAQAYPKQDIFNLINLLDHEKYRLERVYLATSFSLANRSGELLPYQHYNSTYERHDDGKLVLIKGEQEGSVYAKRLTHIPSYVSNGVNVSTITYKYDNDNNVDMIVFNQIPVFKSKVITYEPGLIYRKTNPFFDEILTYINERKALPANKLNPTWLFEKPIEQSHERFFWSFKKRVQKAIKKVLPAGMSDFVLHSLRTSRATDAAEKSAGNIFYVKSITRHRSIKNLEQYVQSINLERDVRKFEGDSNV
jgi:hypothetical protein